MFNLCRTSTPISNIPFKFIIFPSYVHLPHPLRPNICLFLFTLIFLRQISGLKLIMLGILTVVGISPVYIYIFPVLRWPSLLCFIFAYVPYDWLLIPPLLISFYLILMWPSGVSPFHPRRIDIIPTWIFFRHEFHFSFGGGGGHHSIFIVRCWWGVGGSIQVVVMISLQLSIVRYHFLIGIPFQFHFIGGDNHLAVFCICAGRTVVMPNIWWYLLWLFFVSFV